MKKTGSYILLALLVAVYGYPVRAAHGSPIETSFSKTPFCFIENKGQLIDQERKPRTDIDFKLKADNGLNIFIGKGVLHYQWVKAPKDSTEPFCFYQMDMVLAGANIGAEILAEEMQPYHENYYLPQCPNGATAYSYKKITYKNIYPSIDWVLYINAAGLKYDFVVHPGGDVHDIRLKYEGDTSLTLKKGTITAHNPFGSIAEQKPYAYEQETKKEINSGFVLNENIIGFKTGTYDGTLVIDPVLKWATYYGGELVDYAYALARREGTTAPTDLTYIAGGTNSLDNIVISQFNGAHKVQYQGENGSGTFDAMLAAYVGNGMQQWATYYGGARHDMFRAMVTDKAGNIYVAGGTSSDTGIATPGAHQEIIGSPAPPDIFSDVFADGLIVKFNNAGQRIWGTYYGGDDRDVIFGMAIDTADNIYVTGSTYSWTSMGTPGCQQPTNSGSFREDAFLSKFNSSGVRQWSTFYGGKEIDAGISVVCDRSGYVYMAGYSASVDSCTSEKTAIATPGSYQRLHTVARCPGPPPPVVELDCFLAKFNSLTGVRQWGTFYHGGYVNAMVHDTTSFIDSSGKKVDGLIYMGGYGGTATSGGWQTSAGPGFIAAMKLDGFPYWSTYMNGIVNTLTLDPYNALIAGGEVSAGPNNTDGFIAVFNQASRRYYTNFGGNGPDAINAIIADRNPFVFTHNFYIAGNTNSSTGISNAGIGFPIQQPVYGKPLGMGLEGDAFLAKYEIDQLPLNYYISDPPPNTPPPPTPGIPFPLFYIPADLGIGRMCIGSERVWRIEPPQAAGLFLPGNAFTIQLSDSAGSFANPIVVSMGGPIEVPAGTPPGKGYKLRAISSRPLVISNVTEGVIIGNTPSPVASSNSPVCEEDTIKLSVADTTTGVMHYQWVNADTSWIALGKTPFIANATGAAAGRYIITAIADTLCVAHDTVFVFVKPLPIIDEITNNSPICAEDTLQLSVIAGSLGDSNFKWSGPQGFNSVLKQPSVFNTTLSHSGYYYVSLTRQGCTTTDSTLVQIDTLPEVPIATSNSPICIGDTINLFANSTTPGVKYTWYGPAGFKSSFQNPLLIKGSASIAGAYTVFTTLGKCSSHADSAMVVVRPNPEPKASSNSAIKAGTDLMLFAEGDPGSTYAWVGPDSFSSNEQNPVIKNTPYTATGSYTVTETTAEGCIGSTVTIVIVNSTSESFFVLFPNPNDGRFTIKASTKNDQVIAIMVFNELGQEIYKDQFNTAKRLLYQPVSLPAYLSNGNYYLRIRMDGGNKLIPFTIHK